MRVNPLKNKGVLKTYNKVKPAINKRRRLTWLCLKTAIINNGREELIAEVFLQNLWNKSEVHAACATFRISYRV